MCDEPGWYTQFHHIMKSITLQVFSICYMPLLLPIPLLSTLFPSIILWTCHHNYPSYPKTVHGPLFFVVYPLII